MKSLIVRNFVRPLVARLGTAGAVLLVSDYGFDGELVEQFVTALTATALVLADLLLSKWNREAEVTRVLEGD